MDESTGMIDLTNKRNYLVLSLLLSDRTNHYAEYDEAQFRSFDELSPVDARIAQNLRQLVIIFLNPVRCIW
jgi:hypothetical protein